MRQLFFQNGGRIRHLTTLMENHPFPSFNHPFYPAGGHQQTFIDYGSVSTLNIGIDDGGNVVTTSRHRHYDKERQGERLVGAQLTLPLLAPCKNVFTGSEFPLQRKYDFSKTRADFEQSLVEQTSNFCRDHSDVAFQSSIEFVEDELHCKPWEPKCFCYKKSIKIPNKKRREHLDPDNYLERFCDVLTNFPLSKDRGWMKGQTHVLPKGMVEAFHDIPPKLMFDLLNESVEQQKYEKLYFDVLQGNTLAYCNMPDRQSGDGILFYPSGPCLEALNASVVRLKDTGSSLGEIRKLYGKPTLSPYSKTVDTKGPIRQISAVSYEYCDTFVATRNQYNCSFFSATTSTINDTPEVCEAYATVYPMGSITSFFISHIEQFSYDCENGTVTAWQCCNRNFECFYRNHCNDTDVARHSTLHTHTKPALFHKLTGQSLGPWINGEDVVFLPITVTVMITIKAIDNLDNKDQVVSLALSPFIPGEGAAATETGQIHIWHLGKDFETRNVPSVAPKEKWPWYQCVYASNPRCLFFANPVEADIMDLRASGLFSRNLFSVTSKQVSTFERISAIQRNAQNTHHYVIATDQSLLIMDDRFIQHPVLKWRHHLQDPVQHIEVINSAVPGCEDSVIIVSGSQHRETHCFQYNWGEYDMQYRFPFGGERLMNPPVSTVLPWKASSYDEWPFHVPTSILPISSVLDDRLANPLIGVCGIPLTSQGDKKGFTVLQMSSAGDIFYQPFIPSSKGKSRLYQDQDNPITTKDSKDQRISDANISFLKNWVKELVEMNDENKKYEWPLKSNVIETDCDVFRKVISLEEPHPSCVLCNLTTATDVNVQEDSNKDSLCPRCGIDVKYGMQLKKSQTLNFPCSKEIKSKDQSEDLNLLNNADSYQDPLSRNLFRNWFSNTPVPLNLGSTEGMDEEREVSTVTITSDANIKKRNNNADKDTKGIDKGENSQLSNIKLEQTISESGEGQSLDFQLKESSELLTLTPSKSSELIPSPSKIDSSLPSKQVKNFKGKLNQSIGF